MTAARRVVISFPDHWTDQFATEVETKLRRLIRRCSKLATVDTAYECPYCGGLHHEVATSGK